MCEYERGTVADAAVLLLQCQGIVHVLPVKTGTVDGTPGFQQAQLVKELERRADYPGGVFFVLLFEKAVDLFKVVFVVYRLPVLRIHDDHTGIGQVAFRYCLVIIAPFRIDFFYRVEFKSV